MWVLLWIATMVASATEPVSSVASDGTITLKMTVDAPEEAVRAVLAPVDGVPSSDVYEVRVVGHDGPCEQVFRKTKGMWRPLTFQSRRCPTKTGWTESLTESADFSVYETEWSLRAEGTQTHVTYTIHTEVNLSVPSALVRKGTEAGARAAMVTLAKKSTQ